MVERWSWTHCAAADRRSVPRGAGDAGQRRRSCAGTAGSDRADHPLRSTGRAARRSGARRRRRIRPARVRARASGRAHRRARLRRRRGRRHTRRSSERWSTPARSRRSATSACCRATRLGCRSPTASFDRVITSEVLEHIQDDTDAIAEFVRVLKPGGTFAATVPTWFPEKVNWMLSDEYHAPKSGRRACAHLQRHRAEGEAAHRRPDGHGQPSRPRAALAVLVAEVCGRPTAHRPPRSSTPTRRCSSGRSPSSRRSMKLLERGLAPVLGKSYIVYGRKP